MKVLASIAAMLLCVLTMGYSSGKTEPIVMNVVSATVFAEGKWSEPTFVSGRVGVLDGTILVNVPALGISGGMDVRFVGEHQTSTFKTLRFVGKTKPVRASFILDKGSGVMYLLLETGNQKLILFLDDAHVMSTSEYREGA